MFMCGHDAQKTRLFRPCDQLLALSARTRFKPPPPTPPGSLDLWSPQGIDWIRGAHLTPEQVRFAHLVSPHRHYHMLERARILENYHLFIHSPCLFHHAAPLPDGGLRMWFVMGHTPWDWEYNNFYYIWWCCDLRQACIVR